MKISKKIWVASSIKWNVFVKRALCKKQLFKGHAYIVCTSPQERLLFEIVEAMWLSDYYKEETVLAVCTTKEEAVEQIRVLIDSLYNVQSITYADLLE